VRVEITLTVNCRQALRASRGHGFVTAIISGGIDAILAEMVPDAPQLFDYIFINKLLFDGFGNLCGVIPTKYDYEGKLAALELIGRERGITLAETVFLGDALNDEHLTHYVGMSIAYSATALLPEELVTHVVSKDDLMEILPLVMRRPGGLKRAAPVSAR
jgi:phosphoserine phosphatase